MRGQHVGRYPAIENATLLSGMTGRRVSGAPLSEEIELCPVSKELRHGGIDAAHAVKEVLTEDLLHTREHEFLRLVVPAESQHTDGRLRCRTNGTNALGEIFDQHDKAYENAERHRECHKSKHRI